MLQFLARFIAVVGVEAPGSCEVLRAWRSWGGRFGWRSRLSIVRWSLRKWTRGRLGSHSGNGKNCGKQKSRGSFLCPIKIKRQFHFLFL
jgi:hypothetical protein